MFGEKCNTPSTTGHQRRQERTLEVCLRQLDASMPYELEFEKKRWYRVVEDFGGTDEEVSAGQDLKRVS